MPKIWKNNVFVIAFYVKLFILKFRVFKQKKNFKNLTQFHFQFFDKKTNFYEEKSNQIYFLKKKRRYERNIFKFIRNKNLRKKILKFDEGKI